MIISRAIALATLTLLPLSFSTAQTQPAVDFDSILHTSFSSTSGLIRFSQFNMAFVPEGKATAELAVLNSKGEVLARHKVFEDYKDQVGVFSSVMVVGPAEITLTEPGIYTLVYLNEGVPITRCAFALQQTSAGDDPFNPKKTYRFDGPWRQYGHITSAETYKDEALPMFTMWLGGIDMQEGAKRDQPYAELTLNGKVVAHSKRTLGRIQPGHFKRVEINLFHPHDAKSSPNAEFFNLKDLSKDGDYSLKVARQSDNTVIRHFRFKVKDGKLQPHARSDMQLESHTDYLLPRIQPKGSGSFNLVEATWMESK